MYAITPARRAVSCPTSLPLSPLLCLSLWRQRSLEPFSVPISKLPQLVYETQQDIERSGILYNVVGHAGDGKYRREES